MCLALSCGISAYLLWLFQLEAWYEPPLGYEYWKQLQLPLRYGCEGHRSLNYSCGPQFETMDHPMNYLNFLFKPCLIKVQLATEETRGVQIQFNPIKTAKPIQSKSKIDQNRKTLDWIGSYFLQTAWIGSDFGFNF